MKEVDEYTVSSIKNFFEEKQRLAKLEKEREEMLKQGPNEKKLREKKEKEELERIKKEEEKKKQEEQAKRDEFKKRFASFEKK